MNAVWLRCLLNPRITRKITEGTAYLQDYDTVKTLGSTHCIFNDFFGGCCQENERERYQSSETPSRGDMWDLLVNNAL